jgi:biofilm PGA synthesis N-glycosyltransferase PgaC
LSCVAAALLYAVPRMWAAPTLDGRPAGKALSMADTGAHAPVIGEGPLLRVLRVRQVSGAKVGFEPFTGQRLVTLTGRDADKAGAAAYVIQKFGYSATATRTISMTFDDGPDGKVTPELLNVLSTNKVPATFFVIGKSAAKYPQLVQRMVREGHAVGVHTLTHPDIATEPDWREHVELTATARVLRAETAQQVGYWRMPYEGADEASQQATIDGILRAQQLGYTFASHDFDTDDWHHDANPRGTVEDIPLPNLSSGENVTMLLHDAGGPNRARTVAYVKKLIPYAKAHGYVFQSMPQVQPALRETTRAVTPSIWDQLTLYAVKAVFEWPNTLVNALFVFAMVMVVLVGFGNAGLSALRYRRRRRTAFPTADQLSLRTSVVLAAWNEEAVVARTLRSILASDYPILELLVVDDGSTDRTADEVRRVMTEDSRVRLLRQPNSGKAHALNRGVQEARGDFVVSLDADTIMAPDTITKMLRHFAVEGGERLGAVAGVVRVGNREKNLLTRWQALEYLTQIGVERSAQDALGAISIIPGACAAWRKVAILDAGGYSNITLAEDCDLALTMHHLGWKVTQDDEALAYTEAPETVDDLLAQRTRWTFGTLQAIHKHRGMLFRRRFGALGWFVLPNYILSVVMPVVFMPFVVFIGFLAVQEQGWGVLVKYFVLFMLAHMAIAAVGVRLMRERYHHLAMVPVYRVVYEPLRAYLLYTSVFLAIKGVRMGWKKLVRTGSMDAANLSPSLDERVPRQQPDLAPTSDDAAHLATPGTRP